MAKKKTESPSLLDNVSGDLGFDNPEYQEGVTQINDLIYDDDEDDTHTEEPDQKEPDTEDHVDESDIPDEVLKQMEDASKQQQESDDEEEVVTEEVDPQEAIGVATFFDAFAEALHWDVDEDEKPNTIEGLIDYINNVVETNSTPEYADDRIAQLDAYVKNGGNFEDFYRAQQQQIQFDNIDTEDESNQKTIVREYMRLQGFNDEQINRKIERYEDADMLGDEAEDALVQLKQIRAEQLRVAQEQQAAAQRNQEEQARQFMTDLNTSISQLDNIRGIAVPKEDRKALLDYITKTDADGLTQYQKDFNNNMVNNLIESAYFTMKGDALLGEAKRNGQTSAANKLRTMLRHQTKNHSTINASDEKQPQAWDIASRYL